jgi:hypothetical protein
VQYAANFLQNHSRLEAGRQKFIISAFNDLQKLI